MHLEWLTPNLQLIIRESGTSVLRVLIGLSYAALAAIPLGLLFAYLPKAGKIGGFILEFIRPIPPIAWIPMALLLFGTGNESAYFVIFLGAFFPIYSNMRSGVTHAPRAYLEVARSLNANTWRIFKDVLWPAALPSLMTGLRTSLGAAWMCVVVAEMISSRSGLGYQIDLNRQLLRIDQVCVWMVVIGLLGAAMQQCFLALERRCLPWLHCANKPPAISRIDAPKIRPGLIARNPPCGLELSGVNLNYDRPILKNVNLKVGPGEIFSLIGKSGSGKTSLLKAIMGQVKTAAGAILFPAQTLTAHKPRITYLPQAPSLYPWKTVEENILFGMNSLSLPKAQKRIYCNGLLALANLKGKNSYYPAALSGGEQQRVGVLRALAFQPDVLLLDEPFSALDLISRRRLQEHLRQILKAHAVTVVLVTHDLEEAIFMGDKIGVLGAETRTIIATLKPRLEAPRQAQTRLSKTFLGLRHKLANLLKNNSEDEYSEESSVPLSASQLDCYRANTSRLPLDS